MRPKDFQDFPAFLELILAKLLSILFSAFSSSSNDIIVFQNTTPGRGLISIQLASNAATGFRDIASLWRGYSVDEPWIVARGYQALCEHMNFSPIFRKCLQRSLKIFCGSYSLAMKNIQQILSLEAVLWDIARMQDVSSVTIEFTNEAAAKPASTAAVGLQTLHDRVDEVRMSLIAGLSVQEAAALERQRAEMRA